MIKRLCTTLVLTATLALALGGCGTSTDDLAAQVRASMEETFAQDATTRHVQIQDFTLVHQQGNTYKGTLNTLENGEKFTYTVEVIDDGDHPMWELQP